AAKRQEPAAVRDFGLAYVGRVTEATGPAMSGSPFKADLNSRNMARTAEENAHPRRGRHDDPRRRDRGKPLARAPRRRLPPAPHRYAGRGGGRHPRLRRQSSRETSG